MKRCSTFVMALFFALALPLAAAAMQHEHGSHGSKMDHGKMDHQEMIVVGNATVEGVKAEAHLDDVAAEMKKHGQDYTHHFMVTFADAKSGKAITEGTAALKITAPDGKSADPIRLIGMDGHFGADIKLQQKGAYTFDVGTKLPDGQKRTFEFKHTLK